MSFFDRQGIPESVLRVQQKQERHRNFDSDEVEQDTDNKSNSDTEPNFEDNITILSDFSLISVGETFTIHRLVQLTVRIWLKSHGQLKQWRSQFINNLHSEFPIGQYENWERCQSLFPHIKSAALQRPESQASLQQWASLLYRGAWYAQESGNVIESREMAARSRKYRLKIFGAEDQKTLNSATMLAVAYRSEGRLKEAEQLEVQVIETSKTKLGADHPDTLTSMANLASIMELTGRHVKAIDLLKSCLAKQQRILGLNHPLTVSSANKLLEWEIGDLTIEA